MFKKKISLLFICIGLSCLAQEVDTDFRKKYLEIKQDTIQLDSVPLNSQSFKVLNAKKIAIPKSDYSIDFYKAILIINSKKYREIYVEFFRLPDFVRKIYSPFDEKLIIRQNTNEGKLYSLTTNKKKNRYKFI